MNLRIYLYISMLFIVLVAGCKKERADEPDDGTKFPEFEAAMFSSDKTFKSAEMEGLSLIFIVSDFCGPCHLELERMTELAAKYTKEQLSLYIGVVSKGDESVKKADSLGLTAPVFVVDSILVRTLDIRSIPQRIMVSEGNEIMRVVGASPFRDEEMVEKLDEILGIVRDTLNTVDSLETKKEQN